MSTGIIMGNVLKLEVRQITVDIASSAANTTTDTTVTVPGLEVNDMVFVNKPSTSAGLAVGNARVSAANTLVLTMVNPTAGAVDPASETYLLLIVKGANLS